MREFVSFSETEAYRENVLKTDNIKLYLHLIINFYLLNCMILLLLLIKWYNYIFKISNFEAEIILSDLVSYLFIFHAWDICVKLSIWKAKNIFLWRHDDWFIRILSIDAPNWLFLADKYERYKTRAGIDSKIFVPHFEA